MAERVEGGPRDAALIAGRPRTRSTPVTRADIADWVSDHYGADFYRRMIGRFTVRDVSVLAGEAWTATPAVPLGR